MFGSDCIWLETCRTYSPDHYSVQYCHCSKLDCSEKLKCDSGGDVEIEKEKEDKKQDQDYIDDFQIPGSEKVSILASDASANNWFNTAFGLCLESDAAERLRCQSVLMQKISALVAKLGLVNK